MRVINMNTGEGYKLITFPDSQPHVVIDEEDHFSFCTRVICSLTSPGKLVELLLVSDALNGIDQEILELHIPYLLGARYDRRINKGDSFDLKVFADLINSVNAQVHLYDPHSNVAELLIKNVVVHTNEPLVEAYEKENAVLIIPDAGAAKKAEKYPDWNTNIVDTMLCLKKRDLQTGKVLGVEIFNGEKCAGRNCVIIDDLCDGGRTFTAIVDELRAQGWIPDHMTLIVTHGLFSNGFLELSKRFDHIITSNTYLHQKGTYKPDDSGGGMKVQVVEYDFNPTDHD